MDNKILLAISCLILAFGTCYLVIRLLSQRLIDTPNHRSSHSIPTPRGGGIALAAVLTLYATTLNLTPAIFIGGAAVLLIFIISLLDDFFNLNILWRLSAQVFASLLITYPFRETFFQTNSLWPLAWAAAILMAIWLTNLYNFMDGINGLAALEAISCCIGVGVIGADALDNNYQSALIVIGFGNLGFLAWNFPKASLFMGDSGSATLGFIFAGLTLLSAAVDIKLLYVWIIMLGVFVVDASYTLAVRLLTGQKFYQAHRSHSYQRIADRIGHTKTSLLISSINLIWLMPIAWLSYEDQINPTLGTLIAYTPLLIAAKHLNAGAAS